MNQPCNKYTDLRFPSILRFFSSSSIQSSPMKLSFSLSSSKPPKPSLKPSQDQPPSSPPSKQFVTEFDPSKTLTNPNSKTPDVIAPIANEWRPQKKVKRLDLPDKSEDPNLEFEVVNSTIDPVDANMSYGLNLRVKKDSEAGSKPNSDSFQTASSIDRLMLNKLRSDLSGLPEDGGIDEFEDMPVENFATALLKGYGWQEGQGIGKNAKEDVKVFEFKKRTGKEGLGFVNDLPVPPTKSRDANSKKDPEERKERVSNRDHKRDHVGNDKKTSSKRARERYETSGNSSKKSWLNSHIRVRIISKELKGGRLYLKKGEVVDVVGPTTCDISMDGTRELIQGVDEKFLETALPRRGGPVLVLCGRYKGVYGSLQEKDTESETAVVRDADTHALINVKLEQIAEYVGDLDDIGY